MNTMDDFILGLPPILEPEFVMKSTDEPIQLASGHIDVSRDGRQLGSLEGELSLQWNSTLRIVCTGETTASFHELQEDRSVDLHFSQLGMSAKALVTNIQIGQRNQIVASLLRVDNSRLQPAERCRFYLVNFPCVRGEAVRFGKSPLHGVGAFRLTMKAKSIVCTIDRIESVRHLGGSKPGFLLTHVGEIRREGQPLELAEMRDLLDAVYWLSAFLRGARTGPILPSVDSPFINHWVSLAPWIVDEPRVVETWLPDRSPISLDSLFEGFTGKWADPAWNEGLRTTLSWYIAANAPSTPNEARIPLCQIALDLLASLHGLEDNEQAHERIRALLVGLGIPTDVPSRLKELANYAGGLKIDAPETLTRIRNKLEHPTARNRQHLGTAVDGVVRMQAAQYGLELLELSILALLNYRGKYARRVFQGWKGDDEVSIPWA